MTTQPPTGPRSEAGLRGAMRRVLDDELANLADDGARLSHSVVRRMEAVLVASEADRPKGVELTCDDCAADYAVWFAPNDLWNLVMGGSEQRDDPGGMLCPRCFTNRADRIVAQA